MGRIWQSPGRSVGDGGPRRRAEKVTLTKDEVEDRIPEDRRRSADRSRYRCFPYDGSAGAKKEATSPAGITAVGGFPGLNVDFRAVCDAVLGA